MLSSDPNDWHGPDRFSDTILAIEAEAIEAAAARVERLGNLICHCGWPNCPRINSILAAIRTPE